MRTSEEQQRLYRLAMGELTTHVCGGKRDVDNCAACAYTVYPKKIPNVAGWARVMVQAGQHVEDRHLRAELDRTDNVPYVEALKEDLATFQPAVYRRLMGLPRIEDVTVG